MISTGNNGAGWWEPYGSGGTRDSLLSCRESARWWQENRNSEEMTPNPPPFPPWKNRTHKFNGLIKGRRRELAVNWMRAHKTNAGTCLAWLARAAIFTSLKMFYYCKRHALHLPYCVLDKGWWNIKVEEHGANRSRRPLSLLAFRQLLSRDAGAKKWKETKFQLPGASRRTRRRPMCSSKKRTRS